MIRSFLYAFTSEIFLSTAANRKYLKPTMQQFKMEFKMWLLTLIKMEKILEQVTLSQSLK